MTALLARIRGILAITEAGAAPAFDPATLFANSERGFWYDPSDLTTMWTDTAGTIQASVGDAVARIDDKSGNGLHATQSTVADRPILRQSGGLYYLEFDGAGDKLVSGSTNSGFSAGFEITAGVRLIAGNTSSDRIVNFFPFARGGFQLIYHNGNNRHEFLVLNQGGSSARAVASTESPPATRVITGSADLSAPEISIHIDGVQEGTATPTSTGMFNKSSSYDFFDSYEGYMYQLILVSRPYTGTEKADTENYTAGKTGITL